jgi:hypothetical protein
MGQIVDIFMSNDPKMVDEVTIVEPS